MLKKIVFYYKYKGLSIFVLCLSFREFSEKPRQFSPVFSGIFFAFLKKATKTHENSTKTERLIPWHPIFYFPFLVEIDFLLMT